MSRFGKSRPTKLAVSPLVAGLTLFLVAGLVDNRWLLLLSGASFGVVLAAIGLRPRVDGYDYIVDGPTRTVVGEQVSFTVHVHNMGTRTTSAAHVTHGGPGLDDVTFAVPALPPRRCAIAQVRHTATTRSVAAEGHHFVATSTAPFGLQQTTMHGVHETLLIVHPAPVPPVPMHVVGGGQGDAATSVVSRSGLDVHGIREFRYGDTARDVHWRSSARRGRLVVLEREERRDRSLVMIIAAAGTEPDFESLVATAASTAAAFARTGSRVVLVSGRAHRPTLTDPSPTELLDWFAGMSGPQQPSGEQIDTAFDQAGRGATVVVATTESAPQAWWDWLRQRAAVAQVRLIPLSAGTPR